MHPIQSVCSHTEDAKMEMWRFAGKCVGKEALKLSAQEGGQAMDGP